jgi:hypothetical protein
MTKPKGPTKWAERILDRLNRGEKLCLGFTDKGPRYWLEPSNRDVTIRTAAEVIDAPYVEVLDRDLFGSAVTWRRP